MKYMILILAISFYIEGIISNFVSIFTRFCNPLLSLMTIIAIYPFFKNNKRYYQVCFIYGIIYDIVYTDTLIFHGFLFSYIAYLIHYMYKIFSLNILNIILLTFIAVVAYRSLSYILLCLVGNYQFIWLNLFHSITSSLLLNMIYIILLYLFCKPRYHYIKI